MSKDEIIEKIKKLLRMKRGGTPAEVETALALAAELARKHGINLDGVDPDHVPDQPIGHIDAVTSSRIQWECKYASLVCQQFFNVTVLLRQMNSQQMVWGCRRSYPWKIVLIGTERDTAIALYVYHFLVKHFRRCWSNRANRRLRDRQAFLYGMYYGLCTKLDEQAVRQVNEAGLIVIGRELQRRSDYMKANFGETGEHSTVPDEGANASKHAGYLEGKRTEIRSAIGSNGKAALLLQ